MLQIRCKNNNITKSFPEGTSLLDVYQEFADEIKLPYPVVAARASISPSASTATMSLWRRTENVILRLV